MEHHTSDHCASENEAYNNFFLVTKNIYSPRFFSMPKKKLIPVSG